MAAVAEMGEVDDIVHSSGDSIKDAASVNGNSCGFKDDTANSDSNDDIDTITDTITVNDNETDTIIVNDNETVASPIEDDEEEEEEEDDIESPSLTNHVNDDANEDILKTDTISSNEVVSKDPVLDDEVQCIDNEVEEVMHLPNGTLEEESSSTKESNSIVNDVIDNEDVLVIDDKDPIENGSISSNTTNSSNCSTPTIEGQVSKVRHTKKYNKRYRHDGSVRRRSRVVKKGKCYEVENDDDALLKEESESDIEEILPEDPLADTPAPSAKKSRGRSSTIVIKDTKSLVDIASISTPTNSKNEPTLVIIDTNSILSGRGPVPVAHKQTPPVQTSSFPMLPMALPAQGLYPPNMRATITPIPFSTPTTSKSSPALTKQTPSQIASPPLLPTLTDDMYVVEAPSFIVPYVYEKPPVNDLKELVKTLKVDIKDEKIKKDDLKDETSDSKDDKKDDEGEKPSSEPVATSTLVNELKKLPTSYFESPLGKFFMGIGSSLVQELVQTDLLRQQKKKRDRESGGNAETIRTINTLLKNLEFTKENNEPFHLPLKKCEFCSFRTESALAMSFHLETPHMKNYLYKCNFCTYEVRSPHDILYHMEVQHGVRGRLERAPGFHQCPNCPFEDNQKGKLSRHMVTCARKFKPERNLEPPIDYEPPAKIPRAPRMKQQGLGPAAAVYQAMARSPQLQMLAKLPIPQANINVNMINRNRGRPALSTVSPSIKPTNVRSPSSSMIFKSGNMSGGSVLLPSNYQMPGNQVYQTPTQSQQSPNLVSKGKSSQPSISITPLPRGVAPPPVTQASTSKPGDSNSKNSFVICEICDGYIKDLEQLRNHMQWIHKVKIHPKMIYNRPPLNCQKCQFRFFTDQGLERHLLGSHGLVTSSMQEAANKSKDSGRCPVCGRVYQWKLLNHVARDHNMTLKPAHLSYKCTVCTATFGMYKLFESHVYSAHSIVAKRAMDKKNANTTTTVHNDSVLKPLKINDEITIIPQPTKSIEEAGPSTSGTFVSLRNNIGHSNGSSEIHEVEDDSSPTSSREKRRKISPSSDN